MKTILKSKKGWTLIEAMLAIAIMGIVTIGILQMFQNGIKIWNYSLAKLSLISEANYTMGTLTKVIQGCEGSTIQISRFDNTQPVNSYITATLAEPLYIEAGSGGNNGCGRGGFRQNSYTMAGSAGNPMQIYQQLNKLIVIDSAGNTITISTHIDSLMFTFDNSQIGNTVIVGSRFSETPFANQPPIQVFMQKTVVITHMSGAGFYQKIY